MTKMTPEILPTMPYSEGSRTCAKACMSVLPPNDAMYLWLQIYLEHTAALQSRIEALEKAGQFKRVEEDDEVVVGDYIFHMERMADDHIWYQIEGQAFDLYVKKGKLCWLPQTPHGWADLGALAAEEKP